MEYVHFDVTLDMFGTGDLHRGMNMERAVVRQEFMYAIIGFGQ